LESNESRTQSGDSSKACRKPKASDCSIVTLQITGTADKIEKAKGGLAERVKEIELEEEDRVRLEF